MAGITYQADDVQARTDEQRLADVDTAIHELLTLGQAFTVIGSRSVTMASLAELRRERAILERRILMRKGWTGRTSPDFSDSSNAGDVDDV